MGSAVELEYFLLLASDLKLISSDACECGNKQALEVKRMLGSLIRRVQAARELRQRSLLLANRWPLVASR